MLLGLGSILGTGVFVSLSVAAGAGGPLVVFAIAVAAIVAICNGLSSARSNTVNAVVVSLTLLALSPHKHGPSPCVNELSLQNNGSWSAGRIALIHRKLRCPTNVMKTR